MTVLNRMAAVAGAACMMLVMPALADVPAALDRVPTDALLVVVAPSMDGLQSSVDAMQLSGDAAGGLAMAKQFLSGMEGLNAGGSLAIALMPGDMDAENGPLVAVVPVSDFGAFAGNFNAEAGSGVQKIDFNGESAYIKNLGGGFAAISPLEDLIGSFEGGAGNGPAHEKAMGDLGNAVAGASSMYIVANIPAIKPMIQDKVDQIIDQMEMAAEMGGQQSAAQIAMTKALIQSVVNDARTGVLGFNADTAGMSLDFAAQFEDGTESAGYLMPSGPSSPLLGRVPSKAYLFAGAMNSSGPGLKKLLGKMIEIQKEANPDGATGGMNFMKFADLMGGFSMVMGTSPGGLMGGGLFANTVAYSSSDDPAALSKAMNNSYTEMDGQEANGITYHTSFEQGADTIDGTSVDSWSMRMAFDPGNPAAQQAQMMMGMLFGPAGGLTGYMAPTETGLVTTYAKNTDLMREALAAAKDGNGLNTEQGIVDVAAHLPADRSAEFYIGVKGIWDTVSPMMAMMVPEMAQFEVAENLHPIGISGSTADGALRMTLYVPKDVSDLFQELSQTFGGNPENNPGAPEEDAGQPRF